LCQLTAKGAGIDVIDEGAFAGDLDDGEPFPIARLELVVAGDVDFLEPGFAELGDERCPRALAEVAALPAVERYG
jgi:hypothetical protein